MSAPAPLIVNRSDRRPAQHRLERVEGRRPAGCAVFDIRNDIRRTERLPRIHRLRGRPGAVREVDAYGEVAVKVVDDRGIESLKVIPLD